MKLLVVMIIMKLVLNFFKKHQTSYINTKWQVKVLNNPICFCTKRITVVKIPCALDKQHCNFIMQKKSSKRQAQYHCFIYAIFCNFDIEALDFDVT